MFSVVLLLAAAGFAAASEPKTGTVAPLTFEDVDGNELSTADGHVTIITVVTRAAGDEARMVAEQVPDRFIGDPKYRYITLVNFQGKLPGALHAVTRGVIRGRLDAEAKGRKPKYEAKNLARDPRHDIHVVADFDGKAVSQLGLSPDSSDVEVFVFNGEGKIDRHWTDVPPNNSLGKAIAAAAGVGGDLSGLRRTQYLGTVGSISSDQASIPPARLTAFCRPACCSNCTAWALRTPLWQ